MKRQTPGSAPLDAAAVRRLRWRAQRLAPRVESADPAAVVRAVGAVQSQDPAAAALALRARCTGFVADDLERARVHDRSVIRTWCHRSTLHLVPTEDLGWLLELLRPTLLAGRQRNWVKLGFDDETHAAARGALHAALADGPLTRGEIGEAWTAAGIDVTGYRLPHLITRLAIDGDICDGPDRGRDRTWVRLADWVDVPDGPQGDAALAELARRHLAAHGPAEPRDLAAWSGLSVRDARTAWGAMEGELTEVTTADGPRWVPASAVADDQLDQPAGVARLLGGFDNYLLGYHDRRLAVPPPHTKRVSAGGLRVLPAAAIDGVVVGTWRLRKRRREATVEVEAFETGDITVFAEEAADVGRFLGLPAALA